MRCVFVCNGEFSPNDFCVSEQDFVIAVDGGYAYIKDLRRVDLAVGDFDSLGYIPEGIATLRHDPIKDYTDTYLAFEEAFNRGYDEFIVYGALGGRLDHTFANLQCAYSFAKKGVQVKLIGKDCVAEVITGKKIIGGSKGQTFSLFSFDEVRGVYIKNGKYPLVEAMLENTFPLGVSNELLDNDCEIEVKDGYALLIVNKPEREK
ncbi:MAG: thiamine diphosphokinase [Clostridia bacterium]|nr:thiamine diphosphokinase [Clostridia bacterium]